MSATKEEETLCARFLEPEEYFKLEPIFKEYNRENLPEPDWSKVAVIELDEEIIGFFVFEIFPIAGPMWIKPDYRSSGLWVKLVEMILPLAQRKYTYVIASKPETITMCEKLGLKKIESPVYVMETKRG